MAVLCGLPEEAIDVSFTQRVLGGSANAASNTSIRWEIGVGVNSTTTFSGSVGSNGAAMNGAASTVSINLTGSPTGRYIAGPTLGLNNFNALERTPTASGSAISVNYQGGEEDMLLMARYMG
jgi:hypothetical protein